MLVLPFVLEIAMRYGSSFGIGDLRLKHQPDCHHRAESDGYDVTGVRYVRCFGCDAFIHEPLVFKSSTGVGSLYTWPDWEHTPFGHESGLLDFPKFYGQDWTFHRSAETPRKEPVVRVPIGLAFNPIDILSKKDAHEHEGVSFHEVWTDPIARIIWLGYKPFMVTDQHFRSYCVSHANDLRKQPGRLLGEYVSFHFGYGLWGGSFDRSVGAQLVPYLAHALASEGLWPYFKLPACILDWKYLPARKAA